MILFPQSIYKKKTFRRKRKGKKEEPLERKKLWIS